MTSGILILATRDVSYLNLAIVLALSIKKNNNIPIALIHSEGLLDNIPKPYREIFDHLIVCDDLHPFEIKTRLYEYSPFDNTLYLDSDTIMCPGWKLTFPDVDFTAYCNDLMDMKTMGRHRGDYTFWGDPRKIKEHFKLTDKLPQINSSYLWFRKTKAVKKLFKTANDLYHNDDFVTEKYGGARPDEFCFNVSCALNKIYPHQYVFRPIYLDFVHPFNAAYIVDNYMAMSLAGNQTKIQTIALYNKWMDYYMGYFGFLERFPYTKVVAKSPPMKTKPIRRGTLMRSGELPNSDAGCFNPSAAWIPWTTHNKQLAIIYRKEKGIEKQMYIGTTAMPHLICGDDDVELKLDNKGKRFEDFRLFNYDGFLYCSHSFCNILTTTDIECKVGLSLIDVDRFEFLYVPDLPIEVKKVEKNWVFFSEGMHLWCIYSLQPYRLFYSDGFNKWTEQKVVRPSLGWFHDGFISNSTNPIVVGDSYLVFFHSKQDGGYHHGAALINCKTKRLTHATPNRIEVISGGEGLAPRITYVSGALLMGDKIRVFMGEGDSHSIYNDFNANDLITEIKRYRV